MAGGGSSPGAKTRLLRLSLLGIAVALGLLVALLPGGEEGGPSPGGTAPDATGPAAGEPLAELPGTEAPEIESPGEPPPPPSVPESPDADAPGPAVPSPDAGITKPGAAPRLYLVIDDVGNRAEDLSPYLTLDIPMTFAVLPQLTYSSDSAARIAAANQEVILHLPMEAEGGKYPGPGTIYVGDTRRRIASTLAANLQSVPGAKGINNHMGSKATADRRTMDHTLDYARREGLFFLDSRTTHRTVALEVAREQNVPAAERHIFLDNDRVPEAIRAALYDGVSLAKEQGYAVLIGHATSPELALVLKEEASNIRSAGIEFAYVSELMGP